MSEMNLEKGFYLLVKHKCLDVDTGKTWFDEPKLHKFDDETSREEEFEYIMSGYDMEDMYFCTKFEVE